MEQTWKNATGETLAARVPENIRPYVEALGEEATAAFILEFGGSGLYISTRDEAATREKITRLIGEDGLFALFDLFGNRIERVPVSPVFVARHLKGKGKPVQAIARILHRTDKTVRDYLCPGGGNPVARIIRKAGAA